MKPCRRCQQSKPITDFYAYPSGGTKPECRPCDKTSRAERYANNNGIDVSYEQVLIRDYGITLQQYSDMLRSQGNRCAVCRRPETVRSKKTGKIKRLHVDHDHATNTVRALLCHRCNLLVWALEDNHTTLGAVEAYVLEHRESFANGAPV